jgi:hypothetical protein
VVARAPPDPELAWSALIAVLLAFTDIAAC